VWAGNTPEYCLAGGFCSYASPNVQAGRIFETLGGTPMELVEIESTYKASFSFLGAGAIVPIVAILGGQFGMADLGDTATFSFNLPDDVSYISSSGHFLEGSPTPESSTWASCSSASRASAMGHIAKRPQRPLSDRWPNREAWRRCQANLSASHNLAMPKGARYRQAVQHLRSMRGPLGERKYGVASVIRRPRISPSWLFILPAFLLGAALERPSSAQSPCPSARLRGSTTAQART
jgi:hypothetical protein